ncbi:galactose-1-phosphate uridylyltransferase [Streptomyces sp. NPDC015171]|uniref:galactose-1-phosphate uridylyltransferase n=1 Tax=Streptomyces sp. NPDC015171 TaxID=3364945 RepID=UPI0036FE2B39
MTRSHRTSATLTDGRRVHYYDEHPGRPLPDAHHEPVPGEAAAPSLRRDPTTGEWILMAPHRRGRSAAGPHCPLCADAPHEVAEVPGGAYDVAVFDNRFPALGAPGTSGAAAGTGLLATAPAPGRCEVISYSGDHGTPLARLPLSRVRTVVDAWADRTEELNRLDGVEQVVCFENRGAEVGASLDHPHGQIYAYPWIPDRFRRMQETARQEHTRGAACLFCDVLAAEEQAASRVVARSDHWTAFVPFAARWPFEVHLYARRHVPDLAALRDEERDDLAAVYRSVLRRFETVADRPLPYMAVWVQAPARGDRALAHLRAEVFTDRWNSGAVKRMAAGELGAGAFVSETDPERAAEELRRAPVTA